MKSCNLPPDQALPEELLSDQAPFRPPGSGYATGALTWALLVLAFPVACEAQPPPEAPPATPAATTAAGLARPTEAQPTTTRLLSLDEAVQTALRQNPSLDDALAALRRAEALVAEARAIRLPRLDADARLTVTGPIPSFVITLPPLTPGGQPETREITFGRTFSRSLAVTGSYNTDPFGKLRDTRRAALNGVEVARGGLYQVQNELVYAVQNIYLAAMRGRALITVASEAVEAAREQLRVAEAQFRAGTAPEFDVVRASVQVANERQALVSAEAAYRRAVVALGQVLSLDPATPVELVPLSLPPEPEAVAIATARQALEPSAGASELPLASRPGATAVPRTLESALAEAFGRRPEVYRAEWARRVAEARLTQQRKGSLPDLNVAVVFNYQPDLTGFAVETKTWTILANITAPLWDGGLTRSRVRQARAEVDQARAQIDIARDRVVEEVRTAMVDLQEATDRRRAAAANTAQAREALRIARVRYSAGLAASVEVTDAQVALTQARSNEVNAGYDYLAALANLNRSLGRYADTSLRSAAR